jgi:hypothetical protein
LYGYGCVAARLFISTRDKIVDKSGRSEQVRYLKIEESSVLFLPAGLGDLFPKLLNFRMEHAKLREIHQKDLKDMIHLERLYLEGNDIQALEKDLFKFNPKLVVISFRHNHIKHVDPNVFDHLTSLEGIGITINPCLPPQYASHRNVNNIVADLREKCKPRPDGSAEWRLNDDEEVEECECGCGIFVFFILLLLGFVAFGWVLVTRKKKISLAGLRDSVFYGRIVE